MSKPDELLRSTTAIVSAYLRRNAGERGQMESLIREVFTALRSCFAPQPPAPQPKPAVPINRSVLREHLVCLECGKQVRVLTRHLPARHGLSPEAYRARWHLSRDYPLVAPGYAAWRSELAKAIGLGRKQPAPPPEPERRARPRRRKARG